MSDVRPLVLPTMDEPEGGAAWIGAQTATKVQPLTALLKNQTAHNVRGTQAHEHSPKAVAHGDAGHGYAPDEDDPSRELVMSRLPAPPGLGAFAPGARSNPPPANDAAGERLDDRISAFAAAAIELAIARAAALSLAEGQLLDLAIEIAAAVIDHEVERDPELHSALARAALRTLGDCSRATLRTSPDAFHAIRESMGGERIELGGVRIEIVSDPSIPGLGCIVDAEHVRVDATVVERLRAVRIAFEDERRRRAGGIE
jgi:hypothetical protein